MLSLFLLLPQSGLAFRPLRLDRLYHALRVVFADLRRVE